MSQTIKMTLATTIVVISFAIGFFFGGQTQKVAKIDAVENTPQDINLAPMWKAWSLLEENFVPATTTKQITKEDNVWGMIKGLTASYNDPYTVFFPPAESKMFEEDVKGTFGGIGVEIGIRDGILTVISPLKGSPGDKAGLVPKDLIVEIDGESTRDMSIDDAVNKIRGDIGTEVILKIARKGENDFLTVPITRGKIEIPTTDAELRDDGIYVISLYNFGGTAMREMRSAMRDFIKSDSDKLIIDLRGNPGGYLEAAVDIASWFLPLGETVVTEDYGPNKEKNVHHSKGYDVVDDNVKIAILVNGGSASAAEILAGALREQIGAVLIGTKTFGKGSVQELIDVTDNTSIKITIARWLTPNGISISGNGLTPDLEIKITPDDIKNDKDPQLDSAVKYLLTGELISPKTQTKETKAKKVEETDEIE